MLMMASPAAATVPPTPVLGPATSLSMPGSGGFNRTLIDRFNESVDVRDYGAVGNGTADDTAAFTAAFAAAQTASAAGSVKILIPAGRYMLSAAWKPAISMQSSFAIVGAGPGMTTLVFAGTDGFDVTATTGQTVVMSGLRVLTGNTAATYANTGISVTSPTGTASRATLQHLEFGDANGTRTHAWATALALGEVVNSTVADVRILMPDWIANSTSGIGISVGGPSAGNWAIDNQFVQIFVQGGWKGLCVTGYAQGIYVNEAAIVGDGYGLYWNGTQSGDVPELLTLLNSEISAHFSGVYVSNGSLSQILGNHLVVFAPNAADATTMIDLEGGNNYTIGQNVLQGGNMGTENGIVLDNLGQTPNTVVGNSLAALAGKGIWFEGNTRMSISAGNAINGPLISSAVQDDSGGYNALGPVIYNGNKSPTHWDGVNFYVDAALLFASTGHPSSVLSNDGSGGLSVTNTAGSGSISVQGNVTSAHNVIMQSGGSLITQDSTGSSGVLSADGQGGIHLGTLRSGGVAAFSSSGPVAPGTYTVASLPANCTPGQAAYASDARKTGEAAGNGSGSPVFCTLASKGGSATWWSTITNAAVVN